MYTEKQITEQLKALGIKSTDTLIAHTSLKSVGEIDTSEKSGADVLISALRNVISDGLLLIPAFTYANIRKEPVFDIRNTMPCIGAVPCAAVKLANQAYDNGDKTIIRSKHHSHSVVAFGKNAYEYTKDDAKANTPTPMYGSIGKLYEYNAKILLIGLEMISTTFIHAVDEYLEPDGVSAPYPVTVTDYDGTETQRQGRNCQGPTKMYYVYEPYIKDIGGISYGKIGDADTKLILARKCFDAVVQNRETVFKKSI